MYNMVYKVNLNSNEYFSTNNDLTTSNRTYGIDWSFLPENEKFLMSYNFTSDYSSTKEYPPIGLTSNTTTISDQAYGNGSYIASASTTGSGNPWNAFDFLSPYWRSLARYPNNGLSSTNTTEGTVLGEWIQIQLPVEIILEKFLITPNSTSSPRPIQVKLLGSNDTVNPWNILYETSTSVSFSTINVNSTQSYKFYRLVVLTNNGSASVEIRELRLFEKLPIYPSIISINSGSTPSSVKASNHIQKQQTYLAGVLKVKKNQLYANANHHEPIMINSIPSNNFISIDLLAFDGVTRLDNNVTYLMTLNFETVEK